MIDYAKLRMPMENVKIQDAKRSPILQFIYAKKLVFQNSVPLKHITK